MSYSFVPLERFFWMEYYDVIAIICMRSLKNSWACTRSPSHWFSQQLNPVLCLRVFADSTGPQLFLNLGSWVPPVDCCWSTFIVPGAQDLLSRSWGEVGAGQEWRRKWLPKLWELVRVTAEGNQKVTDPKRNGTFSRVKEVGRCVKNEEQIEE